MTLLTVVVTAHDETAVSGPTLRSAEAAVACARGGGVEVEQIVVLDRPTEATTAYFEQARFDDWDRRVLDEGDLGRVRNVIASQASGRYLAFLDADDLFSENWLAEGVQALRAAEERGERVIAHPELNVFFDAMSSVLVNVDQDSPLFTPSYFYLRNYYDSLCLAPRSAHLEVPYVARDIPNGLSFQDFQFAIETMARGWRHLVVRDTIIFKRRRDHSLVTESSRRRSLVRALPEMAIDRVAGLGRAPDPDSGPGVERSS